MLYTLVLGNATLNSTTPTTRLLRGDYTAGTIVPIVIGATTVAGCIATGIVQMVLIFKRIKLIKQKKAKM